MKEEQNKEYLNNLRHSTAHLLAAAVIKLWPNAKNAIGPAIENGFYQDFDLGDVKISEADFEKIENKMRELASSWKEFEIREVSLEQARKDFTWNKYKLELIEEFAKEGKTITENNPGNFLDLCKGGHTKNPKNELKHFKLLSVAGAYWRGSEKNKMLTRIYGTAFPTQKELDQHLRLLEEAKKRDHRALGESLDLFTISEDVGKGLILWLPKGTTIKEELEKWDKQVEKEWGYQRVSTPHITKSGLYYTSGHLPYYKDDMYPPMIGEQNEEYYLKPMNCPHHHMIYKSKPRSYRDLPLRLAEFGTCYRYEASGELFGLMRVRGFTQNDSHIYCTFDQAVEEFVGVTKLHEFLYKILGITKYHLELGLRDPNNLKKYHGDEAVWQQAEKLMRTAVEQTNIEMVEKPGSAAFYGPKIDFVIHSAIGREFAISTNQIDLFMGERFKLRYIDSEGKEQTPVIIHRAPLGSDERFIGFLIEHYGGKFPLWLSPVQAVLIPIADRHFEYARSINNELITNNIRSSVDDRSESMQAKIRDATLQKVPYMGIIGDKEVQSRLNRDQGYDEMKISVRTREGKDLGQMELSKFIHKLKEEIDKKE